eukprot:gb/GEZN01002387.1/.p1 GENE.gb/GEZN01002387.1/~~gb/GEZN01002387.1/.p1  ORF type:complete len:801 (-),score=111.50 gb/GEZN01002387.1/:102-2471(-)
MLLPSLLLVFLLCLAPHSTARSSSAAIGRFRQTTGRQFQLFGAKDGKSGGKDDNDSKAAKNSGKGADDGNDKSKGGKQGKEDGKAGPDGKDGKDGGGGLPVVPTSLWVGPPTEPSYALKTFYGRTPNSVQQDFTPATLDHLFSASALQNAIKWQVENRFLWCGTAADPDTFSNPLVPPPPGKQYAKVPYACPNSPAARAMFEQALSQRYGFADNEAACSFLAAAKLDPTCALPYLGYTLAVGPNVNYNDVASPEALSSIFQALISAQKLVDQGLDESYSSIVTIGLLESFKTRFVPAGMTLEEASQNVSYCFSVGANEKAYLDKLWILRQAFPDDEMVALVTVGALMQNPAWKWWQPGSEYPNKNNTPEIQGVSETIMDNNAKANQILADVLSRNPESVGANHYFIHNVEAGPQPLWAKAVADMLLTLQQTGHVQHMAAHIYSRIGWWKNSVDTNKVANNLDFQWSIQRAGGLFLSPFYRYEAHDIAFQMEAAVHAYNLADLCAASALMGRLVSFLVSADPFHKANLQRLQNQYLYPLRLGLYQPLLDGLDKGPINATGYFEYSRNKFVQSLPMLKVRLYAESVASSRTGDTARARRSLAGLAALMIATEADARLPPAGDTCRADFVQCVSDICQFLMTRWNREKMRTLDPSSPDATGTTTISNGDPVRCLYLQTSLADYQIAEQAYDAALHSLTAALSTQQQLQYDEPSPWFYPIGATLGRLYLLMGQPVKAAETFRQALFTWPADFQLVMGLHQALKSQESGAVQTVDALARRVMRYNDTAFNLNFL